MSLRNGSNTLLELGYAEISRGGPLIYPGPGGGRIREFDLTVRVGERPLFIEFFCPHMEASAPKAKATLRIMDGDVAIHQDSGLGNPPILFPMTVRRGFPPGEHSFGVEFEATDTWAARMWGEPGNPIYFRVSEML